MFFESTVWTQLAAEILAHMGALADQRRAQDLAVCAQPIDFIGLNYYTRSIAQAPVAAREQQRGYRFVQPDPQRSDLTQIGWKSIRRACTAWSTSCSNNGRCHPSGSPKTALLTIPPVAAGVCDDRLRCSYLQQHLAVLAQMVANGMDIRGYYVWSLLDNFEWAHGYTQRFGVVHVVLRQPTAHPQGQRPLAPTTHSYLQVMSTQAPNNGWWRGGVIDYTVPAFVPGLQWRRHR